MNVTPKYLKALLRLAASHDIRYYLNGVLVEATKEGGKFYVATDGYRLGVFHEGWGDDEPQDARFIIPRAALEWWRVSSRSKSATLSKSAVGDRWELYVPGDVGVIFVPINGEFPEWRDVLSKLPSGEPGDFCIQYLHEFDLMRQDLGLPDWAVTIWQNGPDGVALVTMDGQSDFVAALMPQRTGKSFGSTFRPPAWYPKAKEAQPA